jgi:hypothetical protein
MMARSRKRWGWRPFPLLTYHILTAKQVARLPTISSFATTLLQIASPKDSKNMAVMREWFDDKRDKEKRDNIEAFLCQSVTFFRSRLTTALPAPSFASRQASAKLHVQYGTPIFYPRRGKYAQVYPYAVSMVYDLRNYKEESLWGPYLEDGQASVDWEKVEAVMIVLGWNLRVFTEQRDGIFGPRSVWREPWVGASPESYEGTQGIPEAVEDGVVDPYGVQGTWMRVVCFLGIIPFPFPFLSNPPFVALGWILGVEWLRMLMSKISTTSSHTTSPRRTRTPSPPPPPGHRSTQTKPSVSYPWKSGPPAPKPLAQTMARNYRWCSSRARRRVCMRSGSRMRIQGSRAV